MICIKDKVIEKVHSKVDLSYVEHLLLIYQYLIKQLRMSERS